jgi:hypothetical protein
MTSQARAGPVLYRGCGQQVFTVLSKPPFCYCLGSALTRAWTCVGVRCVVELTLLVWPLLHRLRRERRPCPHPQDQTIKKRHNKWHPTYQDVRNDPQQLKPATPERAEAKKWAVAGIGGFSKTIGGYVSINRVRQYLLSGSLVQTYPDNDTGIGITYRGSFASVIEAAKDRKGHFCVFGVVLAGTILKAPTTLH